MLKRAAFLFLASGCCISLLAQQAPSSVQNFLDAYFAGLKAKKQARQFDAEMALKQQELQQNLQIHQAEMQQRAQQFAAEQARREGELKSQQNSESSSSAQSSELKAMIEEAGKGDATAEYNLAESYFLGQRGAPKDYREAARWYRLAADQGDSAAQVRLPPGLTQTVKTLFAVG